MIYFVLFHKASMNFKIFSCSSCATFNFCSYHILTSSEIYYGTETWQNVILSLYRGTVRWGNLFFSSVSRVIFQVNFPETNAASVLMDFAMKSLGIWCIVSVQFLWTMENCPLFANLHKITFKAKPKSYLLSTVTVVCILVPEIVNHLEVYSRHQKYWDYSCHNNPHHAVGLRHPAFRPVIYAHTSEFIIMDAYQQRKVKNDSSHPDGWDDDLKYR